MEWGGLLSKLGQTWPAKMGQGILDAVQLPGQVAGGLLATRPSQPGMWSDEDEARSQATQGTMMNRAADLGGVVMGGGYGSAPAGALGVAGARMKNLPMDDAARMARAKEQGYDVDTRLYHGSPTFKEGMNFDPHHPARTDTGYLGQGIYATPSKWVADVYAKPMRGGPAGETIEMVAKKGNYRDVIYDENYGANLNKIADELGVKARFKEGSGPEALAWSKEFGEAMRKAGYDGARGVNVDGTIAEMAVYNPAHLRSVNARFDPANDGKNMLLGSGNPLAALIQSLGQSRDASDDLYRAKP